MGTKKLLRNELPSAFSVVYDALSTDDAYAFINDTLLQHLSTTGAGDFVDVSELSYFIHEVMMTALYVNAQEYDLEAAATSYLNALGGNI